MRPPGSERARSSSGRRVAAFGLLLAAALVLRAVEGLIPVPFPFVRLGLANIATVLALFTLGVTDAVLLTALRVVAASVIAGTFLGPGFAMSLTGGLAAAAVMAFAYRTACPPLGVVGLSLLGAAAHNLAQLVTVGVLFTGTSAALRLAPAALLLSAFAGLITGLVAHYVLLRLPGGIGGHADEAWSRASQLRP